MVLPYMVIPINDNIMEEKFKKYTNFSLKLDIRTIERLKNIYKEKDTSWNLLIIKLLNSYERRKLKKTSIKREIKF